MKIIEYLILIGIPLTILMLIMAGKLIGIELLIEVASKIFVIWLISLIIGSFIFGE